MLKSDKFSYMFNIIAQLLLTASKTANAAPIVAFQATQEAPKRAQEAPKTSPRSSEDSPQMLPESPQIARRGIQNGRGRLSGYERLETVKEAPRRTREAPKGP